VRQKEKSIEEHTEERVKCKDRALEISLGKIKGGEDDVSYLMGGKALSWMYMLLGAGLTPG